MFRKFLITSSEKGQSLTELALTMTFLLILLAGVADIGRAFFTYIALRDAAQEGALFGSVDPDNCTYVENRVRINSNEWVNFAGVQVQCTTTPTTNACAGDEIRVTVTYPNFPITMPFIGTLVGRQQIPISASIRDAILTPGCP
jgi:Flp pilus assembly protein TadG